LKQSYIESRREYEWGLLLSDARTFDLRMW